ncbi:hypothetical protein SH661x_002865 [Planctomicrobium sp. SH661]|uniref:hypothetical protein n=1 Tax=Planctomicrobium sp. SH661 TaxID=3448124 RepID=UPI003F5B3E0D
MNQRELNRAIARITGERLATISHMGFVTLSSAPDPEAHYLDWDEVDAQRNVALFRQRRASPILS